MPDHVLAKICFSTAYKRLIEASSWFLQVDADVCIDACSVIAIMRLLCDVNIGCGYIVRSCQL